jgi:RimJ/RimL family protein N-acetyltransferase
MSKYLINNFLKKNYKFINFIDLDLKQKKIIYQNRNSSFIRQWMFDNSSFSLKKHLMFFNNLKKDSSKIFFLIKRNKKYVGVYSLVNIKNHEAQSGYYLFLNSIKKNLALEFLYSAIVYIFRNLKINKLYGYSVFQNKNAFILNKALGFHQKKVFKNNKLLYYSVIKKILWKKKIFNNKKILNMISFTINNIN